MGLYYTSGLDWAILEEIRLHPFHFQSIGQYFSSMWGQGEEARGWRCMMHGRRIAAHGAWRAPVSTLIGARRLCLIDGEREREMLSTDMLGLQKTVCPPAAQNCRSPRHALFFSPRVSCHGSSMACWVIWRTSLLPYPLLLCRLGLSSLPPNTANTVPGPYIVGC